MSTPGKLHAAERKNAPLPQSEDTGTWADQLLFEHLRTLDARQSLDLCLEACRTLDQLMIAGIRRDHPRADHEEISLRLAALKYGADAVEACTGQRFS